MQCAAVSTHLGEIKVPPQKASYKTFSLNNNCKLLLIHEQFLIIKELTRNLFNTATCHGQLPRTAGRPPIILVK